MSKARLLTLLLALALAACQQAPLAPAATPALAKSSTKAPLSAPSSTPSPTFSPTPTLIPTPEPTPFSMVWMSDTQGYAGQLDEVLISMMNWTAGICAPENVVALLHTGDIVEDMASVTQWENVRRFAGALPDTLLRVTACGNHDAGPDGRTPDNYLRYRIDTQLDPEKSFLDGQCRYVTLQAGGVNILLLSIAYLREAESVEWARAVLDAHPEHYAILLAHSYCMLYPFQGDRQDGYTSGGRILCEQLVKPSPNLRMVLCGHVRGSATRPLDCDDDGDGQTDRTVQQLMLNYQEEPPHMAGYLRLLRFDAMADSIEVQTYSPYIDQLGFKGDPLGAVYRIENAGLSAFRCAAENDGMPR